LPRKLSRGTDVISERICHGQARPTSLRLAVAAIEDVDVDRPSTVDSVVID